MGDQNIKISFKHPFTERAEYEMPLKGYRNDVLVNCPDGKQYQLCFYDPVRLAQDIESEDMIFETGLVIVRDVTLENIHKAVNKMWETGYFDSLMPL